MKWIHAIMIDFPLFHCRQILKPEASLLGTLEEMYTLSLKLFFNSLNCQSIKLLEKVRNLL